MFAAAERDGFGWSVHRPHTIIGYAVGNAMNMGVDARGLCDDLPGDRPAVLVSGLGRAVERPDRHDRRAPAGAAAGMGRDDPGGAQPGLQHRQRRRLPLELDVAPAGRLVRHRRRAVSPAMRTSARAARWRRRRRSGPRSPREHGLAEPDLGRLASAWHTDADLGRPIEVVTDMSKSRQLGLPGLPGDRRRFFDLFARLREGRIIP